MLYLQSVRQIMCYMLVITLWTKFHYRSINLMQCIICAVNSSDVMIVPLVCSSVWFSLLANLISSSDVSKR